MPPSSKLAFTVAPGGDDHGPGATRRPFATLEAARDAIRSARKRQGDAFRGATVTVRNGDYVLTRSFELTADDSGTPSASIEYRAAGKSARLLGGKVITGFAPVTDPATLARLTPDAKKHVLVFDLRKNGVTDFGELTSRGFSRPSRPAHLELFAFGQPMTLARWPNRGRFNHITGVTKPEKDEWGAEQGALTGGFNYEGDSPRRWKPSEDVWVHGYWAYDWANSYERVSRLDADKRVVETAPPHGVYNFKVGQRFYFLNVLEELDEPGEYYVDRATGLLYFWPPAPLKADSAVVSVLSQPLVTLNEAKDVTLRGFTLEATRGNGVEINGGDHVRIAGCVVRNIGDWGVVVNGGTHHTIADCDVSATGDGGVQISGGDRKTLSPANHQVLNNHIHHYGRWSRSYQAGVNASGVGIRVAHNLIHDAPHNGILYGGNEITLEYNEIHSVCLETGDAGAIYTGRDYTYRGNQIRYNFIHHIGGLGMGTMGIYMDDNVSGHLIQGNVLWETTRAVFLGGGRDFTVDNNLFVDCRPSVALDGRGLDKNPVWHNQIYQTMKGELEAMNWRKPPYSTRYPELATLVPYLEKEDGVPPENNVVTNNLSSGGEWLDITWHAKPENVTAKNNWVGADPGFVNRAMGDFRLKPNSPALSSGYQPIPFEKIGPQRDADRPVVPKRSLVWGRLTASRPLMATGGEVTLTLTNLGSAVATGRVTLLVSPEGAGAVEGSPTLAYSLKPEETVRRSFPVRPAAGVTHLEVAEVRAGEYSSRSHVELDLPK